jgi:hypothetical protein
MRELARIAKPGGHIILVLFRKWSLYHLWFLTYAPLPRLLRRLLGKKISDLVIYPYCMLLYYLPFWLGLAVYQKKIGPPRPNDIWSTFNDQFLSPNASYHTITDVNGWALENRLIVKDHFNFCRPGGGALAALLQKVDGNVP